MANIKKEKIVLDRLGDYIPIFIASVSLAALTVSMIYLAGKSSAGSEKAEPRLAVTAINDEQTSIMRVTDGPTPLGNTGLSIVRVVPACAKDDYKDSRVRMVPIESPIRVGSLVKTQGFHVHSLQNDRVIDFAIPVASYDRDCECNHDCD